MNNTLILHLHNSFTCPHLRGRQRECYHATIDLDHSAYTPEALQQQSTSSNRFRHLPTPRNRRPSNFNFGGRLRPNARRNFDKFLYEDPQGPPLRPPTVSSPFFHRFGPQIHWSVEGLRSSGGKHNFPTTTTLATSTRVVHQTTRPISLKIAVGVHLDVFNKT